LDFDEGKEPVNEYESPEYWKNRQIEPKHFWFAERLIELFKPKFVFDYGCGKGFLVFAFNYFGVGCNGFEPSKFARENAIEEVKGRIGDSVGADECDLVCCFDVMEHVPERDVPVVLEKVLSKASKYAVFSICMLGDENFERDKTHVTKHSRKWWSGRIKNFGFEEVEVPGDFPFGRQFLFFEREGNEP
jgi:SAM-dependent methyltransferase